MSATVSVFIGVIGSGKDHNANILAAKGHARVDFKNELVRMCSDIAGYDVSLDYDWFKEMPVGVMRPGNQLMEAFVRHEWSEIMRRHPEIITGRKLLTRVGTEAIRKRHPRYWIDQFKEESMSHLSAGGSVTCADCRFFNEVSTIFALPFWKEFVFCDFRSERYNPKLDHASEKLAQTLLGMGLKDGQQITMRHFQEAAKLMGEEF